MAEKRVAVTSRIVIRGPGLSLQKTGCLSKRQVGLSSCSKKDRLSLSLQKTGPLERQVVSAKDRLSEAMLRGRKPTTTNCTFESFPAYWPHPMPQRNKLFALFNEKQKSDLASWIQMQAADHRNIIVDEEWAAYFGCSKKTWFRLLSDHFLPKPIEGKRRKRFGSVRTKTETPDSSGNRAHLNAYSIAKTKVIFYGYNCIGCSK
jgi:predicted DNA-binding transcriptional regulator AlpA